MAHTKKFNLVSKSRKTLKRKVKGVLSLSPLVPPVLKQMRPGYDFYTYVNGTWLKTVHTPSFRAAYGVSEELEEKIKGQLISIVRKTIAHTEQGTKPRTIHGKAHEIVGRFGLSALRPSVQGHSVTLLKKMIHGIGCIRDFHDISRTLGDFCRLRIKNILTVFSHLEPGKRIYSRLCIGVGDLGLPDLSYYLKTAPGKSRTLFAYGKMLDQLSKRLDLDIQLSTVIPIESYFAEGMRNLNDSGVHKTLPSGIDWNLFFEGVGTDNWKDAHIRILSVEWLKFIQKAMKELSLDQWKILFTAHLILHSIQLLPPPFDDIHSAFFERRLRGQKRKMPQMDLTVKLLQEWTPATISRIYTEEFFDHSLKHTIMEFVNRLQKAAKHRIQQTEWFGAKTKESALKKIEKMRTEIAYPSTLPPLPDVNLETDNLLQNVLFLGEANTKSDLSHINKPINVDKTWDDAVFAVNAYYYSEINQLILPAGSIQWPFYHKDAPVGWNFGGLGAVIAHEMCHAFDSDGRLLNEIGEEENWWSSKENKEYIALTEGLNRLFSRQKIAGHPVNGTLTLNENIADLGGLAIALDALKLEIQGLDAIAAKEAYCNFFVSYAVSWRIKEKPEKVLQGLFLDRHAPAPLRVNLIVSQFDEWYEAFDIKVSDNLYIPPEGRIRIF